MIVIGTGVVENYLAERGGHKGIKAARSQYEAWLDIVGRAQWRNPEDVKASYPKASILKPAGSYSTSRATTIDAAIQYRAGALAVRFFGSHAEYDKIDAETV
jgi:mRNA interferase HigB